MNKSLKFRFVFLFAAALLIGRGPRQIAEELHISTKTVETYRAQIKVKMNLKNAHELTPHAVHWVESNHLN